ncbi:MAG: DUF4468 domain-containing protein [Tannerellaceae bacterium]|nr:DUF4468 domain-containing protein [Tannerellaceae bacterium]
MKHYLWLLIFFPFYLAGQENTRYLEGAVPEIDGKVVFSKEFKIPSFSKEKIYALALEWSHENFNESKKRVVYNEVEEGTIGIVGEEYLVFTNTALSLDRALMSYTINIDCKDEVCQFTVSRIRYEYEVNYQRKPEKYTAEQWISDKHALSKGKLNRVNSKFRIKTIDFVDELEHNFSAYLATQALSMTQETSSAQKQSDTREVIKDIQPDTSPVNEIIAGAESANDLTGYKKIVPEKIPGNIIKLLTEDWMLITAGNGDNFNMMTASWGGLGNVLGKPVSFCFINPARHTYQLIEKSETYTLSFYTEAYREILQYCGTHSGREEDKVKESGLTPVSTPEGSKAFREAWMIIECRKLISQDISTDSIHNATVKEEWTGKPFHKMYIGEIINVWIK